MISFYFQVDFGFNLRTYLDQYNNVLILILFEGIPLTEKK